VGWSLFWAFSLLALLHFIQSVTSFNNGAPLGVEIEVIYSLISLLLLTGMVHIETLLRERLQVEQEAERLQGELESQVKEKTAYLTRAIEELQLEIAERRRMEVEVERTHKELLAASRRAGMAEIADCVLHNVGNMLKSINSSTALVSDQVKQSKIGNVVHIGSLIREHAANLGEFMTHDPRGQKLPVYIAQLAEHLAEEQATLKTELEFIHNSIEHIKTVVAMEQNCAKLAGETTVTKATTFVEAAILKNARAPGHQTGQIPREHEPHSPATAVNSH
jgi:C4-dicarboxylate-specific signal transduction histidine kinase